MTVALIGFAIAALFVGFAVIWEKRNQASIEAARNASMHSRRADNLKQALSVMPAGYLPKSAIEVIITDIEACATSMGRATQEVFIAQATQLKAQAKEWREELAKRGVIGPGTAGINGKRKVGIVSEAAKVIHDYLSRKLDKDPAYCPDSENVLLALQFSPDRAVSDHFRNMANERLKHEDHYKAKLSLEQSAKILKPWIDRLDWADRAYRDCLKRIQQIGDVEPITTGTEKQWEQFKEEEHGWKKPLAYD